VGISTYIKTLPHGRSISSLVYYNSTYHVARPFYIFALERITHRVCSIISNLALGECDTDIAHRSIRRFYHD
jgi:hypothetical protein